MPTEADTCRTYVIPKPKSAGWEDDYFSEQRHSLGCLDGLCPSGRLRQPQINGMRELQSKGRRGCARSLSGC